mgnify:CR=1 FL=1
MRFLWLLLALGLLASGAHADTRAHEDEEFARYKQYAGEPIDEFPMFRMWKWQVVGPERIVIWSTINGIERSAAPEQLAAFASSTKRSTDITLTSFRVRRGGQTILSVRTGMIACPPRIARASDVLLQISRLNV